MPDDWEQRENVMASGTSCRIPAAFEHRAFRSARVDRQQHDRRTSP